MYTKSFADEKILIDYEMELFNFSRFKFDYFFPKYDIGVLLDVDDFGSLVHDIIFKKYNIHFLTFREGEEVETMIEETKDLIAFISLYTIK